MGFAFGMDAADRLRRRDLDVVGAHLLRRWRSSLARIGLGDESSQAIVALIGDSWVAGEEIAGPLRSALQERFGDGGPGFVCASGTQAPPAGVERSRSGSWTDVAATVAARGAGLSHAASEDDSTPGALEFTAHVHAFSLHYLVQPGGGAFRWRVDSGGWTEAETEGAAQALGIVEAEGLDGSEHVLSVEVIEAGTAGVTVLGVDCRRTGNGVRLHRLGAGGLTASTCAALAANAVVRAGWGALGIRTALLLCGTNDDATDVDPMAFAADVASVGAAVVGLGCDAGLITPGPNGLAAGAHVHADYAAALREVARARDWALIDLSLALGEYAWAQSEGLYANASHLSAAGGQFAAARIAQALGA